ncbi:MAG TPA: ribonuclease III [candidate division Zixibacteria bacterium]|nr:ribonuclease III [candidate division Zixibacteria bacterium]
MAHNPSLDRLQEKIGYKFADPSLLVRALTHVSYSRDRDEGHNEVLEFLGDAVLDLAVSDLLIRNYPRRSEGDLSRMRAALVNSAVLAEKAAQLELGALLRLGKGEERSGGRTKESILAGAFEALLGAIYRDGGYEAARRTVERYFAADVRARRLGLRDYKTRLQEISQLLFREPPSYRLVSETGPDHEKYFVTEISVGGRVLGTGEGRSKKQSEQEAARKALRELQRSGPDD